MAELFFIATTIFVAYVVFDVVGKKEQTKSTPTKPQPPVATQEVAPAAPAPAPAIEPVAKTAKSKAAPAKAASTTPTDSLKNPKTGEIAKLPGNYAFAKRWIKDALVEEGLLDKVYKNNELSTEVQAQIQEALQRLKAMPKYQ